VIAIQKGRFDKVRLFTIEKGGVVENGIVVKNGFFTLGNSKGHETLIEVVGTDHLRTERIFGGVPIGKDQMRQGSKSEPIAGQASGAVGILIHNQADTDSAWELGRIVPNTTVELSSPTGLPYHEQKKFDVEPLTDIFPLYTGTSDRLFNEEYFLIMNPGQTFTLYINPTNVIVVTLEYNELTTWKAEDYLEWIAAGKPLRSYTVGE
jgi:hypothetical protein